MSGIFKRIFGHDDSSASAGVQPPAHAVGARGPDEVCLEPAIPGDLDDHSVVVGHPVPGVYTTHDGREIHERCATLTLESGERQRVGVGSTVTSGSELWAVTGFQGEMAMVLTRASTIDLDAIAIPEGNPEIYPEAEVCNLWIQKALPVATWVADLTHVARTDVAGLGGFVDAVLEAGVRSQVMRIHQVGELDFDEELHGPFAPWLARRRAEGAPADLLSALGHMRQSAVLSYFDAHGRLIESPVQDLGGVLRREEPYEGAFDGFAEPCFPITLTGATVQRVGAVMAGDWDLPVQLRISVHSDIWFPWINGVNHPLCDYKRKFDNRLLAERNAPKLNAFLEAVAQAAESAGGTLVLDPDETNVRPEFVTDRGVVIDVAQPADVFTEEDRNIDWA